MDTGSLDYLTEHIELAEQLLAGRKTLLEPQDLPGKDGMVVKALDALLRTTETEAVLAGGWAVWRYGYEGRLTDDLDIVLPTARIQKFLQLASVSGFEVLPQKPGRWPKLRHKETGIKVDILPEGERPGTASKPAPTLIPHPTQLGAKGTELHYITLPRLIELKLAAGRAQDDADVIQLMRAKWDQVSTVRQHLTTVHADYVKAFDHLVRRAEEQVDH